MGDIFLVRHGEDVKKSPELPQRSGSIDTYLTPDGYRQALRAGNALRSSGITSVYAPPLSRTLTTARAICRTTSAGLIVDEKLNGRDMGAYALQGNKGMAAYCTALHTTQHGVSYYLEVPGAESLASFFDRMKSTYESLVTDLADTRIAIVTQHLAGTLLRGVHDGLSLEETLEYKESGHADAILLPAGEKSQVCIIL